MTESNQERVIYVPERGLPVLAPPSHRTVTEISAHDMEYLDLGVSSGYQFTSYHPTEQHPLSAEYEFNDYFANVYRGAGLTPTVRGPCFVVVSSTQSSSGAVQQRADGVVNGAEPAVANMLHLRLLPEQIYREATERAQQVYYRRPL